DGRRAPRPAAVLARLLRRGWPVAWVAGFSIGRFPGIGQTPALHSGPLAPLGGLDIIGMNRWTKGGNTDGKARDLYRSGVPLRVPGAGAVRIQVWEGPLPPAC